MKNCTKKHKLDEDYQLNNNTPLQRMFSEGLQPKEIKKPKKIIDKNAPKRAISSFLLFSKVYRPLFHKDHPDLKNTEISTMLSEKWKSMTMEEKKPYLEAELVERSKYHANMKAYKERTAFKSSSIHSSEAKNQSLMNLSNSISEHIYQYLVETSSHLLDKNLSEKFPPFMIQLIPRNISSTSLIDSSSISTTTTSSLMMEHMFSPSISSGISNESCTSLSNYSSSFSLSSSPSMIPSSMLPSYSYDEEKEKDEDIMNLLNTFDDNEIDLPSITLESPPELHQLQSQPQEASTSMNPFPLLIVIHPMISDGYLPTINNSN